MLPYGCLGLLSCAAGHLVHCSASRTGQFILLVIQLPRCLRRAVSQVVLPLALSFSRVMASRAHSRCSRLNETFAVMTLVVGLSATLARFVLCSTCPFVSDFLGPITPTPIFHHSASVCDLIPSPVESRPLPRVQRPFQLRSRPRTRGN